MRGFFVFLFGNIRFFVILHNMINRKLRVRACGTVVKINPPHRHGEGDF